VATRTELLIEYVKLSWEFHFPEEIEAALEADYVKNFHMYDLEAIKRVASLLLIYPNASASQAIEMVRSAVKS
jgi:hypothetical protein